MKPHQKVNHFPGTFNISRKDYLGLIFPIFDLLFLAKHLMQMKKGFKKKFTFFPDTYILPSEAHELKNQLGKFRK